MAQALTPERKVTCRACGQPFRTARTGKGAYYCRLPECDEMRRATGFTVPNPRGYGLIADEQLAGIAALLADRPREPEPGRLAVRRAITALANADGLPATRAALRRLAVEALAWERRLPRRVAGVRGVDTPAPESWAA